MQSDICVRILNKFRLKSSNIVTSMTLTSKPNSPNSYRPTEAARQCFLLREKPRHYNCTRI